MLATGPHLELVSPPDTDEVMTDAVSDLDYVPPEPCTSEWSERPNIIREARDLGVEAVYGVLDIPAHLLPIVREAASNLAMDSIGSGIHVFGQGDRLVRGALRNVASIAVTHIGLGYRP